jgi:hypothetical protein
VTLGPGLRAVYLQADDGFADVVVSGLGGSPICVTEAVVGLPEPLPEEPSR